MEQYIGKMLDNRYEILEVIGAGGMSVVYKAKCHRLNRLVAIKMLRKDMAEDAQLRRRFHDESQAVAMLSHPNIMSVYDVSRGGDVDYIVMELIDGITLKQYMERRGKLNWPESLHFMIQIMRALGHAHGRGIVHRDIKPQNIMVVRDGTVKVTDFGIARLSNSDYTSHEVVGSVHYISPEQAKGESTDNRSDIYSAGVVLYEMLTGCLPFDGETPIAVAMQHINAVPKSPRELDASLPEALEQICLKAMAPNRSKRYGNAEEMVRDLEAFRKDPSIHFDYTNLQQPEELTDNEPTRQIPNPSLAQKRVKVELELPTESEESEQPSGKSRWKVLLLLLAILVVGYFGVTALYEGIFSSFRQVEGDDEYQVPNVIGMTLEEASQHPNVAGVFTIVDTYYEYSDDAPVGQIVAQDPVEGRTKKSANNELIPIQVTISRGAKSGGMPYLIGEEARNARLILEQTDRELSGLELVVVESPEREYSDTVPEGYVVRTIPENGGRLSKGSTVTLILSKGPEKVTMIHCLGQSVEQVQQQMETLGLVSAFESVEGSAPQGQILTQSIEAGAEVVRGSTVIFTYSDGEKLIRMDVTLEVPFSLFEVYVEVYLDDTQVFASELSGMTGKLELPLYAKAGSYRLRYYVDSSLRSEQVILFHE